jgi:hypothetical protein
MKDDKKNQFDKKRKDNKTLSKKAKNVKKNFNKRQEETEEIALFKSGNSEH